MFGILKITEGLGLQKAQLVYYCLFVPQQPQTTKIEAALSGNELAFSALRLRPTGQGKITIDLGAQADKVAAIT